MTANSIDRLESLLEKWTSTVKWEFFWGPQNATTQVGDPAVLEELTDEDKEAEAKYNATIEDFTASISALTETDTEPADTSAHNPPRRRTVAISPLPSPDEAEYAELCSLLRTEAPFLLSKLPAINTAVDRSRSFAYAMIYARRVQGVLDRLRENRELERRHLVTAEELATYFGKTIGAMQMKLKRIRKAYEECFIERPSPGERARADRFLYRTVRILSELRKTYCKV